MRSSRMTRGPSRDTVTRGVSDTQEIACRLACQAQRLVCPTETVDRVISVLEQIGTALASESVAISLRASPIRARTRDTRHSDTTAASDPVGPNRCTRPLQRVAVSAIRLSARFQASPCSPTIQNISAHPSRCRSVHTHIEVYFASSALSISPWAGRPNEDMSRRRISQPISLPVSLDPACRCS